MARRGPSPVYVGRAVELARVEALRAEVGAGGDGATLLVTGEAGMGKTRFCAEIVDRCARDGWLVLSGACDEFGGRPLGALVTMTPALKRAAAEGAPDAFDGIAWRAIQALADSNARSEDRGTIVEHALTVFRQVCDGRPVLILIDDLHWADESTRELFYALASRLNTTPTLVVGAYRHEEVGRGHPLRPVVAALERVARPVHLELRGLTSNEAAELAGALGHETGGELVDDMLARAGGNTLFFEHLVQSLPDEALPAGIRDVVLARFDALSTDAQAVAEALSLAATAPREVIRAAAELPPDRFAAALDQLAGRGFLGAGEELQHRHSLIREAVASQVGPGTRDFLHGRLAAAFETHAPDSISAIARHWYLAGELEKAFVASLAAARRARRLGAMPESSDHWETVFELWKRVPEPESLAARSLTDLLVEAYQSLQASRRAEKGIELIEFGLAAGIHGTNRARVLVFLALCFWQTYGNEDVAKVLSTLREARRAVDERGEKLAAVDVLSLFAVLMQEFYGLDEEAHEAIERAEALLAETGAPPPALFSLAVALSACSDGNTEPVVHVQRLGADGRRTFWASHLNMLMMARAHLGLHETNASEGPVDLATAAAQGQHPSHWMAMSALLSRSLSALGRWQEASARLTAAEKLLGPWARQERGTLVVVGWGCLLAQTGRLDELRQAVESQLGVVLKFQMDEYIPAFMMAKVDMARLDGDPRAARVAVDEAIDIVRGHHLANCGEPVSYAIGLAADCVVERAEVAVLLARADHWIGRLRWCVANVPGRVRIGDLGVFIEQAEAERGRLDGGDDPARWEQLVERWVSLTRPYQEAYCRLRAASALLVAPVAHARKEARERACEHLAAAMVIAKRLGAIYLEQDIERLQRAAGLRVRPGQPSSAPAPLPVATNGHVALTSREVEVLRLLVKGESNGQIALRLGISVKTASVHVSNILRKLEAQNRVEAAVRASRLGLLEGR